MLTLCSSARPLSLELFETFGMHGKKRVRPPSDLENWNPVAVCLMSYPIFCRDLVQACFAAAGEHKLHPGDHYREQHGSRPNQGADDTWEAHG